MGQKLLFVAAVTLWAVVSTSCTQSTRGSAIPAGADALLQPSAAETARPSPADRLLRAARGAVERQPSEAAGYNLLAAAYMQKAREAEDFALNAKASESLDRALKVAPDDYDALKLRAKLLLTFHRFEDALAVARRAQAANPRDHDNYGALTDALVELGDYPAAVESAQRMVDLRPDTSSYSRVSYLRWLHGDTRGAIEAMRLAAQAAGPQDPEKMAWCHVQLGEALLNSGQPAEAEREFDRALYIFKDYGAALAAKARARVAARDHDGAIEIYRRGHDAEPSADSALALGDLHAKAGRADEAKKYYEQFESLERENAAAENDMHHLVSYWLDHDRNLDEALALARKERGRRKDIYTCDTLAWALYKKGQFAEAKAAMDEALRLGTRDARLHYHAGMIARALGDAPAAAKHLRLALEINPAFDTLQADDARRTLAGLS
ncbi:MAG TPA: tetratricopeptide repeat protein [Pyrinomonadaceae bacterium]|nr:tetratricopeptide repeat protein [Pyrinomonadaceae bacterium]